MDIPTFDGHLHIKDLLDWLQAVEQFFNYMEIPEHQQVEFVAYKLHGGASALWKQL